MNPYVFTRSEYQEESSRFESWVDFQRTMRELKEAYRLFGSKLRDAEEDLNSMVFQNEFTSA